MSASRWTFARIDAAAMQASLASPPTKGVWGIARSGTVRASTRRWSGLRGNPATASTALSVAVRPGARSPAALAVDDDRAGLTSPDTFVEASVDEAAPYVQGQVVLRVKIYSAEPILSGQLSEVQLESAAIERMGDDRSYETTRDGHDYHVIQRTFAIFPQQSGELRIPPVVFEGPSSVPTMTRPSAEICTPSVLAPRSTPRSVPPEPELQRKSRGSKTPGAVSRCNEPATTEPSADIDVA